MSVCYVDTIYFWLVYSDKLSAEIIIYLGRILHWISIKYDRYYFRFIYALHDLPESHFEMEANWFQMNF